MQPKSYKGYLKGATPLSNGEYYLISARLPTLEHAEAWITMARTLEKAGKYRVIDWGVLFDEAEPEFTAAQLDGDTPLIQPETIH